MITINIGDSDEKADWLKFLENGRYKRADLDAHEALEKQLREEENVEEDKPADG